MKDDFMVFLERHVPEYTDHLKKYGSIGSKRIKKMIEGEILPIRSNEPERAVRNGNKHIEFSVHGDGLDPVRVVEDFNNFYLTLHNKIRYEYPDFIAIVFVSLMGGLRVSFTYHEPMEEYLPKLNEYLKFKDINSMIPLVQNAYSVYASNNEKDVRDMRRVRIQRQLKDLQNELQELGTEHEQE